MKLKPKFIKVDEDLLEMGVCRVCGCTFNDPCYNPRVGHCWWVDVTETLCSHCANEKIANDPMTRHCINTGSFGPCATLELVVKARWYDMIEAGVKEEEYREIKPYWIKRLVANPVFNSKNEIQYVKPVTDWTIQELERQGRNIVAELWKGTAVFKSYHYVKFHRGYRKGHRTMTFRIKGIIVGKGNPDWGAPEENVFIIKLDRQ